MEPIHDIDQVADQYRAEGYRVVVAPGPGQVPDFVPDDGVDLIAYKGEERVIIEVKTREDLRGNAKLVEMARLVNDQPGWRFDLVVLNSQINGDRVPPGASEPSLEQIVRNLELAERLSDSGELASSLMIAWATLEAAMRRSARSAEIEVKSYSPLFLLTVLYSNGLLDRGEFDTLSEALKLRNAFAHGMNPAAIDPSVPRSVVSIARKLIADRTCEGGNESTRAVTAH